MNIESLSLLTSLKHTDCPVCIGKDSISSFLQLFFSQIFPFDETNKLLSHEKTEAIKNPNTINTVDVDANVGSCG